MQAQISHETYGPPKGTVRHTSRWLDMPPKENWVVTRKPRLNGCTRVLYVADNGRQGGRESCWRHCEGKETLRVHQRSRKLSGKLPQAIDQLENTGCWLASLIGNADFRNTRIWAWHMIGTLLVGLLFDHLISQLKVHVVDGKLSQCLGNKIMYVFLEAPSNKQSRECSYGGNFDNDG